MSKKFKLDSHKVFYGMRSVPFTLLAEVGDEAAAIPLEIDSVDDLDLEAIKGEIRHTVFNKSWADLEVKHTPERVIEHEGKSIIFDEIISVHASGISLVYRLVA